MFCAGTRQRIEEHGLLPGPVELVGPVSENETEERKRGCKVCHLFFPPERGGGEWHHELRLFTRLQSRGCWWNSTNDMKEMVGAPGRVPVHFCGNPPPFDVDDRRRYSPSSYNRIHDFFFLQRGEGCGPLPLMRTRSTNLLLASGVIAREREAVGLCCALAR